MFPPQIITSLVWSTAFFFFLRLKLSLPVYPHLFQWCTFSHDPPTRCTAAACGHSTPNQNMHYLDVDAPRKTWPEWLDRRVFGLFHCINTRAENTETLPRNQSGLKGSYPSIPCRTTPSARSPLLLPKDFILLLLDCKGNGKKTLNFDLVFQKGQKEEVASVWETMPYYSLLWKQIISCICLLWPINDTLNLSWLVLWS